MDTCVLHASYMWIAIQPRSMLLAICSLCWKKEEVVYTFCELKEVKSGYLILSLLIPSLNPTNLITILAFLFTMKTIFFQYSQVVVLKDVGLSNCDVGRWLGIIFSTIFNIYNCFKEPRIIEDKPSSGHLPILSNCNNQKIVCIFNQLDARTTITNG